MWVLTYSCKIVFPCSYRASLLIWLLLLHVSYLHYYKSCFYKPHPSIKYRDKTKTYWVWYSSFIFLKEFGGSVFLSVQLDSFCTLTMWSHCLQDVVGSNEKAFVDLWLSHAWAAVIFLLLKFFSISLNFTRWIMCLDNILLCIYPTWRNWALLKCF